VVLTDDRTMRGRTDMRTSGILPAATADSMHHTAQPVDTPLRELDHRSSDGTDVRLLWDPGNHCVSIAVTEEETGAILTFVVDGAEALTAFHHPYAYAIHVLG
jgi:hypothetical protein